MRRPKINQADIIRLWHHYFGQDATQIARDSTKNVLVAVVGTVDRTILRHESASYEGGKEPADELLGVGRYFTGIALEFTQMFRETLTEMTFLTDGGHDLFIIPFRTESDDDRRIDTVAVIYGRTLSLMAYHFRILSEKGWDEVQKLLV